MGVSVSANVLVRFSETMDRTSVEDGIRITHGTSVWTGANGSFGWSGVSSSDDNVTFNPFENWPFGMTVTVTLNASVARDPAGFYLDGDADGTPEGSPADDVTWSFTAETTDATPPTVAAVGPPDGAIQVPETTDVDLEFSEAMNRTSVEDSFSLVSAARTWTKSHGTFGWSPGRDHVSYVPSSNLPFSTDYAIHLAALSTDENGNPLDGDGDGAGGDDFVSVFSTRAEPDATRPSVLNTAPADGAIPVPRDTTISIMFDDAMKRLETQGAISLERVVDSTAVALGAFEWSASDTTVSFAPVEALAWDTQYRVFVSQAARDDAGLTLFAPHSASFRTETWTGRVTGVVVEGERPVVGATVTLGNRTTRTNETGAFEFEGIEAGTYAISAAKSGYDTVRLTRTLDEGNATGEGDLMIDLGRISLRRSDLLSPVALAATLAASLVALLALGLLIRRRRTGAMRFDDLEPEEAEIER